ncbi:hypothetical protein [Cellulomonas cellasea]|uniref:hypothetical protein n=1 Tax=Cellulomonas cellasea TaxID=43670 RepID=UPI003F4FB211
MSSRDADEQRPRDLAVLRAVRDRIDREYAQPLNVDALARDTHRISAIEIGRATAYPGGP